MLYKLFNNTLSIGGYNGALFTHYDVFWHSTMPAFNVNNEHPLFKLCHDGKLNDLKSLCLETPHLTHLRASNGSSMLHFAARGGHLPMVKWLLSEGLSEITETNHKGSTALLYAAFSGNLETVQWLLRQGGSQITEANNTSDTALLLAAWHGHFKIVQWLLCEGGSQITEANEYGATALLISACHGHYKIVQWLLCEGGSQITETNRYGDTPLRLAAHKGDLETVQYLLNHPSMTYKQLKASLANTTLPFNTDAEALIDKKISDYEACIQKAETDEAIQGLFKTTESKIIVADELFCPIAWEIISDPVIAADGHLYNKKEMEHWLKTSNNSPKTNAPLASKALFPALHIKRVLKNIFEALETTYQKQKETQVAEKPIKDDSPDPAVRRSHSEPAKPFFFHTPQPLSVEEKTKIERAASAA